MYIKNIQLTNFRNYDILETEFHKNVNLILGNNAQGKTNLLEAVYITSIGRSFRTNKDSDLVRFDADFAKVKVSAENIASVRCLCIEGTAGKSAVVRIYGKGRHAYLFLQEFYSIHNVAATLF